MRIFDNQIMGIKSNGVQVTVTVPDELMKEFTALLEATETPDEIRDRLARENASEKEAISLPNLYPWWEDVDSEGKAITYKEGTRWRREIDGVIHLFQVNKGKTHQSQSNWLPELTPALYEDLTRKYTLDEDGAITDQPKPWDSKVWYEFGDRCIGVDGKVYENILEGKPNTWEPTTFKQGWKEV